MAILSRSTSGPVWRRLRDERTDQVETSAARDLMVERVKDAFEKWPSFDKMPRLGRVLSKKDSCEEPRAGRLHRCTV